MTNSREDSSDQSHPTWESLVGDFEQKLDTLTAALQQVRQAGRRLAQMQLAFEPDQVANPAVPMVAAVEQLATLSLPEAAPAAAPPYLEEEVERDEVRRTVEQARQDLESGGRMAAVGWTMPRDFWPGVTPAESPTSDEEESDAAPDSDPARDEVRKAVEEAKAELAKGSFDSWGPSDAAPPREKQQPASAASWTTMSLGDQSLNDDTVAGQVVPTEVVDEAALREEVRLAVERARLQMESSTESPPAVRSLISDVSAEEDDKRDDVRRAVAQARAEMAWSLQPPDEADVEGQAEVTDEDAKRDEVRRAVEMARAEMSSEGLGMYDDTSPPEANGLKAGTGGLLAAWDNAGSAPTWQHNKEVELAGLPASIVIEDPVGRVELARVYDTLGRVERSAAALLNYTPHSVTVGLAAMEALPAPNVMVAAIEAAFGRVCRVTLDGSKMSVKIGESEKAA
jgi:hypothetical protein